MSVAELELTLRAADTQFSAELRFRAAGTADILVSNVPVAVNWDKLLQSTLDPVTYGQFLTKDLFSDERMRVAWAEIHGALATGSAATRLRLRIDQSAARLHSLRWELLQDPLARPPLFLATSDRILFSRYLPGEGIAPVGRGPRPALSAVIVAANPEGLDILNRKPIVPADEIARARKALGDIPTFPLASGEGPVTFPALRAALRSTPDILYLIAHGVLTDEGPYILLEDEQGRVDRVAGSRVVAAIGGLKRIPRLVILASCQSAGNEGDAADFAMALGPQLAAVGVPAILAMQGNISIPTVTAMMPPFFDDLQRHGVIDQAMAVSRTAISEHPDWWMPVLFMNMPDGALWGPAPAPVVSRPLAAQPAAVLDRFTLRVRGDKLDATWSAAGKTQTADGYVSADQDMRERLHRQSDQLRAGALESGAIRDLGEDLYKALFAGEVGKLFEQALREIKPGSQGRTLRVVADVDLQSVAAAWPLEFVYCHALRDYFATASGLTFFRQAHASQGRAPDFNPAGPTLHVLVVVSLPRKLRGAEPVGLLKELEALAVRRAGLEVKVLGQLAAARAAAGGEGPPQPPAEPLRLPGEPSPRVAYLDQGASWEHLNTLLPALRAADGTPWQPHVLHFVGHGTTESGVNTLVLIKDGRPDLCNMSDLGRALRHWPRVVVLQACQGAAQATTSAFMGLVEELVQQDIQALVVTQARFADNHAGRFAAGFYEALLDGANLDEAVQQGRIRVGRSRFLKQDFGAPVLFTYEPTAIIEPLSPSPAVS